MPKNSIVWLASYPKSGNTWMRVFLANYLFNRKTPMPVNEVHRLGFGDAIPKAYAMVAKGPFDPGDHAQALKLRPHVIRAMVANNADINFVKTHNARTRAFGVELIPAGPTRSAIYILRHPIDVACSYARHYGMTVPEALEAMSRSDNTIVGDRQSVPQYLGNWSDHVTGWTQTRAFPVLTLRYEDLEARPEESFRRVLEHIGVPVDEERLGRAIGFSSFGELSKQEAAGGFIEKSRSADRFFHTGRSGQWRDSVDPALAEAFVERHRRVMAAHGYI